MVGFLLHQEDCGIIPAYVRTLPLTCPYQLLGLAQVHPEPIMPRRGDKNGVEVRSRESVGV